MRRVAGLMAGLLACIVAGAQAQALPRPLPRVASLNLCTDELLLMLAEPGQIIGVSPLAQDCWSAVLCAQARHVPVLTPTAEHVVAARADVVLGGTYTTPVALQAAREAGATVLTLPPATTLGDIPGQIRTIARAIGAPERGEALATAFTQRLNALSAPRRLTSPSAAIYAANGFMTGAGSLADDVLAHAGWRNYATVMRRPGAAPFPLEVLIAQPPDLLIVDRSSPGTSLAQALLDHPALQQRFTGAHHLDMPARLWLCGLPQTLDALAMLRHAHRSLPPSPP